MSSTRMQDLGSNLRRIRRKVAAAIQTTPSGGEGGDARRPARRKQGASVPPGLAISDVMEQGLATVFPGSPVRHAVRLMIEHRISSVPVVDTDGRIMGALNEGDLMQVFYEPGVHTVADVMTLEPPSLPVDAPFVDVIDHLMSSNFRRVLIHDGDGRLVGVVTRSHVMPALLAALESWGSGDRTH